MMCPLGMRGLCAVLVAACLGGSLATTQLSPCRLRFNNGSEINLMKVAAEPLDAPRFKDIAAENSSDVNKYFYNPCYSYVYPPHGESMACSKDVALLGQSRTFAMSLLFHIYLERLQISTHQPYRSAKVVELDISILELRALLPSGTTMKPRNG